MATWACPARLTPTAVRACTASEWRTASRGPPHACVCRPAARRLQRPLTHTPSCRATLQHSLEVTPPDGVCLTLDTFPTEGSGEAPAPAPAEIELV